MDILTPLVMHLKDAAEWFGKLPAPVQAVGVGFVALLAAIGPVILVTGTLASSITTLLPLFASGGVLAAAFGAVMTAITGPIGLTAAAVVALYEGLKYFGFLDPVLGFFKDLYRVISGSIVLVFDAMKGQLEDLLPLFKTLAEDGVRALEVQLANLAVPLAVVSAVFGAVGDQWKDAMLALHKFAGQVEDAHPKFGMLTKSVETNSEALSKSLRPALDRVNIGLVGTARETKSVVEAAKIHILKTGEQIEAEHALAKKLADIHKDWADAARDVGNLTDVQKTSIDRHLELHHRVQDIAADMHLAEPAVADYADSFKALPGRIKDMVDEAVKVRPVLTVMGFEEARKHAVIPFQESLWSTGEAITETADLLETDLTPAIKKTTDEAKKVKVPLETLSGVLDTLSADFAQMAQIKGNWRNDHVG